MELDRIEEEQTEIEAEYLLESPVKCHSCGESQQKLEVVRMLRTKVNFTSALPRRGCVVICPNCKAVASVNIGKFSL